MPAAPAGSVAGFTVIAGQLTAKLYACVTKTTGEIRNDDGIPPLVGPAIGVSY